MKKLWAQPHKSLTCMSFIIIFLTIVLLVLKFHGAENILFVFLFWIVLPLSNGYQNLLEWHVFANWIKGEIMEDFFSPTIWVIFLIWKTDVSTSFCIFVSMITVHDFRIFQIIPIHFPHSWKQEAIKMNPFQLTCHNRRWKKVEKGGRSPLDLFLVDVFYTSLSSQNCLFL